MFFVSSAQHVFPRFSAQRLLFSPSSPLLQVAIVNLQKTPRDRQAHLLVRARVDFCMALLMRGLGLAVPKVRLDVSGEDGCLCIGGLQGVRSGSVPPHTFPPRSFPAVSDL